MKRIFAALLVLLLLIGTVACNGESDTKPGTETESESKSESVTESKSESETESVTESETESESEEETESYVDPSEGKVCFIGDYDYDPNAVYYTSLQEAIAANPNGAEIRFCADTTIEEEVVLPEGVDFIIHYNFHKVSASFSRGVCLETFSSGNSTRTFYTTLELLQESNPELHGTCLWILHPTEGYELGRYNITDIYKDDPFMEPEYIYEYVNGLEQWDTPFVIGCKDKYYYSVQDFLDLEPEDILEPNKGLNVNVSLMNDFTSEEMLIVPENGVSYRIAYAYKYLNASFDRGFTYDDSYGGYCYYSDITWILAFRELSGHHLWVWSNREGLLPGKYAIVPNNGGEVIDEETSLLTTFSYADYTLIRDDSVSIDDFFEEMLENTSRD